MTERRAPYLTDREIRVLALRLLRAGLLASALPGRLMELYGISRERAWRVAREAVGEWKRVG